VDTVELEPGKTHLNAESEDDWYNSLDTLQRDEDRRNKIGVVGRNDSEANFGLDKFVEILAETLRPVVNNEVSPIS